MGFAPIFLEDASLGESEILESAERAEKEGNYALASELYLKAGDSFQREGKYTKARDCYLKAAINGAEGVARKEKKDKLGLCYFNAGLNGQRRRLVAWRAQ